MSWNKRELSEIKSLIPHLAEILRITLNISVKFDETGEKLVLMNAKGLPVREVNITDDSPFGIVKDLFEKL